MDNLVETFRDNEKISSWVNSMLVGFMMTCLGYGFMNLGRRLFPGWDGGYLPVLLLVVTLEALYSQRMTSKWNLLDRNTLLYRFSELITLILAVRIFIYLMSGIKQVVVDFTNLSNDVLAFFRDGEFIVIVILVLFVWILSQFIGSHLLSLEGDEDILRSEFNENMYTDRGDVKRRLTGPIFFAGSILVIISAIMRLELKGLWGDLAPMEGGVWNVILYFIFALILLSQGEFAVLRAGWSWQRVPISNDMSLKWMVYGTIFILLAAIVVSILPTNYSLGFLETIGYVFAFIASMVVSIFTFIFFLLPSLILSLFAKERIGKVSGGNVQPVVPAPLENFRVENAPPPLWELLKAVGFWLVFIFVIGYALSEYLQQNKELAEKLKAFGIFRWIGRFWLRITSWMKQTNKEIGRLVNKGLDYVQRQVIRRDLASAWNYVRLNQLSAREQVLFFYYAMIRRSSGKGFSRLPTQTPSEYAQHLIEKIPEAGEEIAGLTDHFSDALYTEHDIEGAAAGEAKGFWNLIRKKLFRQ